GRFDQIFYVPGNHEFYGSDLSLGTMVIQEAIEDWPEVTILDNRTVTYRGVHFIGSTLWTDFFRRDPGSMLSCQFGLSDFRWIRNGAGNSLLPEDIADCYDDNVNYLHGALNDVDPT